jgi:hypothetical protein
MAGIDGGAGTNRSADTSTRANSDNNTHDTSSADRAKDDVAVADKPATEAPPNTKERPVKHGDTVRSIAEEEKITVQNLYELNPNIDPAKRNVPMDQMQSHWDPEYLQGMPTLNVPDVILVDATDSSSDTSMDSAKRAADLSSKTPVEQGQAARNAASSATSMDAAKRAADLSARTPVERGEAAGANGTSAPSMDDAKRAADLSGKTPVERGQAAQTMDEAKRAVEMSQLQRTNFPAYVAHMKTELAPQDRANPFAYTLDHSIPIEVKRQVFADLQAGLHQPRVEIGPLSGAHATYDEMAGPNGTIRINEDLISNNPNDPRKGQLEALAALGHMEEIGHWADKRAHDIMGKPGGDSLGDEGARYAAMKSYDVIDAADKKTFMADYDIKLSNGQTRSFQVDSVVLEAAAIDRVTSGAVNRDNQVNGVERFGPEGHYQTTYLTGYGVAVGSGMKPAEADRFASQLALGSQLPDMLHNYDAKSVAKDTYLNFGNYFPSFSLRLNVGPTNATVSVVGQPAELAAKERHLANVYESLHAIPMDRALTPAEIEKNRFDTRLYVQSQIANGDPLAAGVGLHLLADTYAHVQPATGESYVGTPGHLWDWHTPDQLYTTQSGNSTGPAATWDKVTMYQETLARLVSNGISAQPNMGSGQLPDTGRTVAAERAITEWSEIYTSALKSSNADAEPGYVFSVLDQNELATEKFRQDADIRIHELSVAAQSDVERLFIEDMGAEGGYTPSAADISALDKALDR